MTRIFFVATLLLLTVPLSVGAIIVRDLSVGAIGNDVLELQQILNSDPATQITSVGRGAPGQEGTYFGPLTKLAVEKFQTKYKNEILTPFGLALATGFVGTQTRLKLNNLRKNSSLTQNSLNLSPQVPDYTNIIVPPAPPMIDLEAEANSKQGLDESLSKTEIRQKAGVYSEKYSKSMKITSISPESGPPGTQIVIKGHGFTGKGNKIYTGYSIINNASSGDGETLVFTAESPFTDDEYQTSAPGEPALSVPLGIYVQNNTGLSNNKMFTMTF